MYCYNGGFKATLDAPSAPVLSVTAPDNRVAPNNQIVETALFRYQSCHQLRDAGR